MNETRTRDLLHGNLSIIRPKAGVVSVVFNHLEFLCLLLLPFIHAILPGDASVSVDGEVFLRYHWSWMCCCSVGIRRLLLMKPIDLGR